MSYWFEVMTELSFKKHLSVKSMLKAVRSCFNQIKEQEDAVLIIDDTYSEKALQ